MLLTRLYLVSLPIILALVLATIAVPPARRLERRGVPRLLAALMIVVGGAAAFLGGLVLLVPAFTRQVAALGPTISEAFDRVLDWIEAGPLGSRPRRHRDGSSPTRSTTSGSSPARSRRRSARSRSPSARS
jgi:predicted PurR-regulated permease PerM